MKFLIATLIAFASIAAQADVGDIYSKFGKVGRYNESYGLVELIGVTATLDHDDNPATADKVIKVALDITENANGDSIEEMMSEIIYLVRTNGLTMGAVVTEDDIYPTTNCLGLDFEIQDPSDPTQKVCVAVKAKDIIVK